MGGYDKGFAGAFAQCGDEFEHVFAVARVEVAGRLVGDDKGGIGCQGARNGYALLLAA